MAETGGSGLRIGLFGGSFDPIHFGHILPIREVREALQLDRVVFLPTADPPHKPGRQFAPAYSRFAMVELALLDEPQLIASAHELTPGRPAYTIDTVRHFQSQDPEAEIHLLIGSDCFFDLRSWRRWQELVEEARVVVLARPEADLEGDSARLDSELRELLERGRVRVYPNRQVRISATRIRRRLEAGEELPADVIPEPVLKYVRKYRLYQ